MIKKTIYRFSVCALLFLSGCASSNYVKVPPEMILYEQAYTQPMDIKELIGKVDTANTEINSFKSNLKFTFNDFRAKKSHPFVCSGKIAIEKPYNLRLVGYSIISGSLFDLSSNGDEFYLYLPKESKILKGSSTLSNELSTPIIRLRPNHVLESFFMQDLKFYYDKYLCFYEYYPETYVLYFVDKHENKPYLVKKIWVNDKTFDIIRHQTFQPNGLITLDVKILEFYSFDDKGYFPKKMKILRPNSSLDVLMEFSKVKIDPKLNNKTFILDIPEGIEIYNLDMDK